MVDFICEYYSTVESLPVRSEVQPGYLQKLLPQQAPDTAEPFSALWQDIRDKIMPGMTHWQSPSFFAYYPANSSFPGILGEMLSGALNIIGFSWICSPAATDLETIVLDWLAKLLNLPEVFWATKADGSKGAGGGVIQGSASEAVLVALLAARQRALAGRENEDALRLVAYASDQTHSSIKKACMVAGVPHCRLVPASEERDWALDPAALEAAVAADLEAGLLPFYLVATVGTTSTASVDPLRPLGELAARHGLWMHVDSAYAGATAMLPECAAHFDGVELVHSFNTNAHKWLLTNFDCSALWVRDSEHLKAALSLTPEYLRHKTNAYDYRDWQVPLGRRFRALKLWFVLRTYGAKKLRAYLRHHINLAQDFAARIEADPRFELAAPQRFSLVCFRLKGGDAVANAELLEAINSSGKAFLVHTEVGGQYMLRLAIGATNTQQRHIDAVWELLASTADRLGAARIA